MARGFDRLSPWYDRLVRLFPGRAIPRSRTLFLDRAAGCRKALIAGGGSGEFLVDLMSSGFEGSAVYLDISPGMLRRARRALEAARPSDARRVEFRVGDIRTVGKAERFDLVCTHYFLDLFREPSMRAVMCRLDRALAADGLWLASDFADARGGRVRRLLHGGLVGALYAFFGLVCSIEARRLPPVRDAFRAMGYVAAAEMRLAGGLLWSAAFRKGENLGDRATRLPTAGMSCTWEA